MTTKESNDGKRYELKLLTGLLQPYFPPEKCATVAKNVMAKFGSAYRALLASEAALLRVEGMTKTAAFNLPMQYQMFLRIRSEQKVVSGNSLYRFSQIAVNLTGGKSLEALYVALLDKSNSLCGCHLLEEGTTFNVNADMRKIYRAVTDCPDVESVIFIHNHPSGCVMPSVEDISETNQIETQLSFLGIKVKDHIVVGNREAFSFSAGGLQDHFPQRSPSWKDEMLIDKNGMPYFPEDEN